MPERSGRGDGADGGGAALPVRGKRAFRLVSGLERVWLAADRGCKPFVNQLVVVGEGTAPPPGLAEAVDRAGAAHPGLAVRLRGWGARTRWVPGEAPALRRVAEPWEARGPAAWTAAPLDPRRGPVCEVVAGPGFLVFRTHHAVTDGSGTLAFARDVFAALRGEAPRGSAPGPLHDAALVRRVRPPGPEARPPPSRPDAVAPTGMPSGGDGRPVWARRTVPAGRGVLGRAMAGFHEAARRLAGEGTVRVAVSADLRSRLGVADLSGNLSSFVHVDLDAAPPAALRARVDRALAAGDAEAVLLAADRLRGLPLGLLAWAGRRAARRLLRTGRAPASGTISNLGRADLAALSAPGLRAASAFWIPPGNPSNPMFLTLAGAGGRVEICASCPAALADGGRLGAFLDILAAAVAG